MASSVHPFYHLNTFRELIFVAFVVISINLVVAEDENDGETLKCIVKYLQDKGVNEDFFSSVDKKLKAETNCDTLINAKLTKAYGKIEDKLKADSYFAKYSPCIMQAIKTDGNKAIILQREAIKINGLGIAVWNYFNQREHLDELKKQIEASINKAATEKCIT